MGLLGLLTKLVAVSTENKRIFDVINCKENSLERLTILNFINSPESF